MAALPDDDIRDHRAYGETILVVEDEPGARDFAVEVLEELGYRALAADDAASALTLLQSEPDVALLFTDVVLTGTVNGRQLADEVVRRHPDVRVLFTTGYTPNAILHHGRLDEGVSLTSKPFTPEALAAKVRELVDKKA
jgi:CheY-like chemotaxis protein